MKDEEQIEAKHPHARHAPKGKNENSSLYLVMVGMVCLLLVLSIVQTVQVSALKSKVQSGSIATGVAAQAPTAQQAPQAPKAAPQMVGGC